MTDIGFSTGALFKDALAEAVAAARKMRLGVIELSALRVRELQPLVDFVRANDLSDFKYISLHAPTDCGRDQEQEVAATLVELARDYGYYVVVHPHCVHDPELWRSFGERLCIENMDKRKDTGRTVDELRGLFEQFPAAHFCFDIAHAHQVDRSMTEGYRILREFRGRICQLHVSEVTSSSKHDRISDTALQSFRELADELPRNVPVILESPVALEDAREELEQAARIFEPVASAAGSDSR